MCCAPFSLTYNLLHFLILNFCLASLAKLLELFCCFNDFLIWELFLSACLLRERDNALYCLLRWFFPQILLKLIYTFLLLSLNFFLFRIILDFVANVNAICPILLFFLAWIFFNFVIGNASLLLLIILIAFLIWFLPWSLFITFFIGLASLGT